MSNLCPVNSEISLSKEKESLVKDSRIFTCFGDINLIYCSDGTMMDKSKKSVVLYCQSSAYLTKCLVDFSQNVMS